jgi:hypothetical protein
MMEHINNNVLAVFAVLLILLSVLGNVIVFFKTSDHEPMQKVTGKAMAYVSIDITAPPDTAFSFLLMPGQNWVSIPVRQPNTNISAVLSSIGTGSGTGHVAFAGMAGCTNDSSDNYNGNFTVVWAYNASDLADHWKSYTPDKPCFAMPTEDLQEMTNLWNYQIMMNTTDNLTGDGSYSSSVQIPLEPGMNWVGFPRTLKRAVPYALYSIGSGAGTGHVAFAGMAGCTNDSSDNYAGNYTVLWSYNASDLADPWKSFTPDKPCFAIPSEDLQHMTPGSGYQLMMNTSEIWVVDW